MLILRIVMIIMRITYSAVYYRSKLHKKITSGKRTIEKRDMELKRRVRSIRKLRQKSGTVRK